MRVLELKISINWIMTEISYLDCPKWWLFIHFLFFLLSVQFQIKFFFFTDEFVPATFESLLLLFKPIFLHFAWTLYSCTPVKVTSSNCQWFCFVYNRFHLLDTWLCFLCFPSIIFFYIWLFMFQLNHVCLFFWPTPLLSTQSLFVKYLTFLSIL